MASKMKSKGKGWKNVEIDNDKLTLKAYKPHTFAPRDVLFVIAKNRHYL
jgi:hypothetical protein